jgi:hypothetical protein
MLNNLITWKVASGSRATYRADSRENLSKELGPCKVSQNLIVEDFSDLATLPTQNFLTIQKRHIMTAKTTLRRPLHAALERFFYLYF